jgi:triacylglycerol esterase/lipase EstA (alpha/beta hydrolase family)
VFIHGFVCNRGVWTPWLRALQAEGGVFIAVNLEPVFGGIDSYVPLIDEAVTRVSVATGQAPVLICHSMGGLAARAWLRSMQADGRVRHVVTLGAPHHGTWLGKFSHFANGRQMRLNGDWVSALARDEPPQRRALFTCWYSHCDNVVFPASTASLPGARNLHVPGTAHMGLVQHPRIMQVTLDALRRDSW